MIVLELSVGQTLTLGAAALALLIGFLLVFLGLGKEK